MTTYGIDTTFTSTTTVYPNTTYWMYPYIGWTSSPHAQKCPNCGYCSCCGKSDIPGKLVPEQPE